MMIKNSALLAIIMLCIGFGAKAQVSGTVFRDANKDNIFQQDNSLEEFSISEVDVVLTDKESGKIVARTKSDAKGNYIFRNLKNNKTYQITFTFPMKYCNPEFGASSFLNTSIFAQNGDKNVNFGLKPAVIKDINSQK